MGHSSPRSIGEHAGGVGDGLFADESLFLIGETIDFNVLAAEVGGIALEGLVND